MRVHEAHGARNGGVDVEMLRFEKEETLGLINMFEEYDVVWASGRCNVVIVPIGRRWSEAS